MVGGLVLIHNKESIECFKFPDLHNLTLTTVKEWEENRRINDSAAYLKNPFISLLDKPDAYTPLEEEGFRRLIDTAMTSTGADNVDLVDSPVSRIIHLYLRPFRINDGSILIDQEDHSEVGNRLNCNNATTISETSESDPQSPTVISTSAHSTIPPANLPNGLSENEAHRWIRNVRPKQKKQYRSDSFPSSRLKLVSIRVAGDVNRRCKVEFKEGFDITHREVDEISKTFDDDEDDAYQSTDDDDDEDEYQLAVVLAKGDDSLEVDWTTLTISDKMRNAIYKSKKTTAI